MATYNIQFANQSASKKQYMDTCSQRGKICLEYVWIDGTLEKLRSITRIVDKAPKTIDDIQELNFDGTLTDQDWKANKDIYLKPVAMFMDPFLGGVNRLVLCETILFDRSAIKSNLRHSCAKVMQKATEQDPWFDMRQKYILKDLTNGRHLGWTATYKGSRSDEPDHSYCSVEPGKVYGRSVVMAHLKACLHAGIKICGVNAEILPSSWEYQIGPCGGIDIGDHVWMSRYILYRVACEYNLGVSFNHDDMSGDGEEAGAHTNFSSKSTRDKATGLKAIHVAIEKLSKKHQEHTRVYGSAVGVFSSGVAKRNVSIRIPAQVNRDGHGYFEDRRPISHSDPYVICERLVKTICLDE